MKILKTYENKILDKILDKISATGINSLTSLEKEYLNKFSKNQSTKDIQQQLNEKIYKNKIGPHKAKLVLTDVEYYDDPNYGEYQRWNGTLYIENKKYEGFIYFKNIEYLYNYFENIYDDFEGLHYEIDQFCENAFYSLQDQINI